MTFGTSDSNGAGEGTEFLEVLPPPGQELANYDNTLPCSKQGADIPQIFRDAMSVREEVYGEQGVPLEAEFDEDDARSWHWVVYASVASTASSPPKDLRKDSSTGIVAPDETRRSSADAGSRLPVGTIRLIPGPHGPNKYLEKYKADRHTDADPPSSFQEEAPKTHPLEPYVKLGRLAVLAPYRKLGLGKLLINAALKHAAKQPEEIYRPPSPTTMEMANLSGKPVQEAGTWNGLVMIHAQANLQPLWERYGFSEELRGEDGEVEIQKEERWIEEGIEHVGMWKRLKVESGRL
ncbi:hypothetical protein P280DRAFT_286589 [Massarina eburnea CBS 473.64]|uniref:N-acetyltransferase domain-containing protein n=1 Tax=Massarina eburnea CBS 473.64 TaxID=1395130 RepID=A0A6A6S561_9PLEO|nr:hypothetical protein P280DRAFT_286589 [Massarina eburnea CBS 473.64]